MFYNCSSLFSLPDISIWNAENIDKMDYIFSNCSSLVSLPNLSKWNTSNLKTMECLLSNCISLSLCPDITKWNNFKTDAINKTSDYNKLKNYFAPDYKNMFLVNNLKKEDNHKIFSNSEFELKLICEIFEGLLN